LRPLAAATARPEPVGRALPRLTQALTMAIRAITPDAVSLYADHRDRVLRVLAWRASWLDRSEREAIFHDAYAVLLEKERNGALDPGSMPAAQVRAYLTQTALNKALDAGKRARRRHLVPLEDSPECDLPQDAISPEETAVARSDAERVRELVSELPDREQLVIKLRFFFDRSPTEIRRHLGITERTYRRLFERAMRTLAARYELGAPPAGVAVNAARVG
jgi:RNA polymerase sigma factor (sigma-70 family)